MEVTEIETGTVKETEIKTVKGNKETKKDKKDYVMSVLTFFLNP